MREETKIVEISAVIPVSLRLHVQWKAEAEETVIVSVELAPNQNTNVRHLEENLDMDTLEAIEEMTKEAFGITETV